jgi:hypothetical protein
MSYFAAACGAGLGMMIGIGIFSNAWRTGLLPKDYDFIHEYGKSLIRIDNKKLTYGIRLLIGMLLHPVVFVFIWGKDGYFGINLLNSSIVSAIVLLAIESTLFGIVLWTGLIKISPKNLVNRLIGLQFVFHIILGFLMGFTYDYLPI